MYPMASGSPQRWRRSSRPTLERPPRLDQLKALRVFVRVIDDGSFAGAARSLDMAPAVITRLVAELEAHLGARLLNRTTRRLSLTDIGEAYLERARRILAEVDDLNQLMSHAKGAPRGLLRVNASLGFGRMHVAPAIARFAAKYPEVEVQLQLTVQPPPLSEDAFDLCVRFGEPSEASVATRLLVANRRLLCAAPKYIARHGQPRVPQDLVRHNCIVIRQGDEAYSVWRLSTGRGAARRTEAIKVRGSLSANDGEVAVNWALDGLGILMRSEFDVQRYLASGRLVQVLPQVETPGADIYAAYPQRHRHSVRVHAFADFLAAALKR